MQVVQLSRVCDNRCVFCAQAGAAEIDSIPPFEGQEVAFVGGEPGLDPQLVKRVAEARAQGATRVLVQSNGSLPIDDLVAAGLTDLHLTIHGARPEVHDWIVGRTGALSQIERVLARARSVNVVASTVLVRSSYAVIDELPTWLAARGVRAFAVVVPRVAGRAIEAFDRVVPRLALSLPHALRAIDRASIPGFVMGAPSCLLGPFRALRAPTREYGTRCEGCPSRSTCPGIDGDYLARFGEDELRPGAYAAPEEDARFPGIGTEVRRSVERPSPPSRARVSLPMLGKVQAGRAEVSGRAPKKTGDELREILPELFEDER